MRYATLFLFIFIVISISGCKKDTDETGSKNIVVHTAGHNNADMIWWAGTKANKLAVVPYGTGEVKGIAIANGNVYVAGFDNSYAQAILWTNGQRQQLSAGTSRAEARCVAVSGQDIYVGGYEAAYPQVGVIWKNGQQQTISGFTTIENVKVVNGQLYMLGYSVDTVLYKTPTQTVRLATESTSIRSMYVDGSDVYVCGVSYDKAVYWKNGQRVLVCDSIASDATDISVVNNNVYVVGTDGFGRAVLWKNGIKTNLQNEWAYAFAVAVDGDDVYVAGTRRDFQGNEAGYWVNGKFVKLASSTPSITVYAGLIALEKK